ncbi:PKD domain-containing protein [Marinifilum sp. D714]|uniref:PKD domain-containing protein n=1 Tax=Marinifilum sp. D714 TaxID=2937523 RepID=UPI0027C4718B|nr:PKD domain-containing protein [Marinifilum sp. D714]MDQ2179487.1 PKD domain-containing protein [Marinifilum sp. D714]
MKMNRVIGLLLFGLIAFTGNVLAQNQTVTLNSTHEYSVSGDAITYTWAVSGGTASVLDATNTQTIVWNAEGTYTLTVFGTDGNGCVTETRTAIIEVVGTASVMFAKATGDVTTCSPLLGDPVTPNNFDVVFTGGVPPYELTYETTAIDGSKSTTTISVGVDGDATPLTTSLTIDDFENTSGGDQTISIQLISATTKDGEGVVVDTDVANNTRSVTVNSKPTISGTITLN